MPKLQRLEANLKALQRSNHNVAECLKLMKDEAHTPLMMAVIALASAVDETSTVVLDMLNQQLESVSNAA